MFRKQPISTHRTNSMTFRFVPFIYHISFVAKHIVIIPYIIPRYSFNSTRGSRYQEVKSVLDLMFRSFTAI